METAKMLELLSVQRHDFLNHLQVISGLIQLKKEAAAREYIKRVTGDIISLSKVVHLNIPEVAAVLLYANNRAANHRIEINFDIQINPGESTVPGELLAALLGEVLNDIIDYLSPPEVLSRKVSVSITGTPGDCTWQISFGAVPDLPPTRIMDSARRAEEQGVRLKVHITG
ncbi:sensor histidine kinase [Desulfallas thermosapovorans]|uniref:Sensor kinase SpoOB-type protein n=1 Tax=Desulfallas thermosapovorans DSM 6562 TaxID=1121431 RepID=A0A5S5A0K3_9FIRM|nr:Spo0B domain-containing protein [Desulfallas thermosapovorans]TYO98020.1 sensor kinase SpoOB-type protein [Desulfallas thermosapovorans DSM 6562]